jgi:hypothetical protein
MALEELPLLRQGVDHVERTHPFEDDRYGKESCRHDGRRVPEIVSQKDDDPAHFEVPSSSVFFRSDPRKSLKKVTLGVAVSGQI